MAATKGKYAYRPDELISSIDAAFFNLRLGIARGNSKSKNLALLDSLQSQFDQLKDDVKVLTFRLSVSEKNWHL